VSAPFPAWWFDPVGRLALCLCLSKEVDAVKLASAGVMNKLEGMLPGVAAVRIGESLNLVRMLAPWRFFTHQNELIVAGLWRTRPSQPVQHSLNAFLKIEGTKVKPIYSRLVETSDHRDSNVHAEVFHLLVVVLGRS
jgi:hypothetical protein